MGTTWALVEELWEKGDVPSQRIVDMSVDLAGDGAPRSRCGARRRRDPVDVLICNHARSGGDGALGG